jgi:hypothetical protein
VLLAAPTPTATLNAVRSVTTPGAVCMLIRPVLVTVEPAAPTKFRTLMTLIVPALVVV